MRILLAMNLPCTRVHGGTNRSNRSLAEGLADRGHTVHIVCPMLATPSPISYEEWHEELQGAGVSVDVKGGVAVFDLNGVAVQAVAEASQLRAHLIDQINEFRPDWILVSSEDPTQNLLHAALRTSPSRVIYLAHTPQMFPFGPASLYPGRARTELVGQSVAIVAISKFVANYIKEWAGFEVFVNHPPHYGKGPFPHLGRFDGKYVLLLNACQVKGISIFLALADSFPQIQFAALAGYGTTRADLSELGRRSNAVILRNRAGLDDILSEARVVLVPTLWVEGFGMVVVDSLLRGIPALASNFGGLTEAKLGTDYLLPVQPIEKFEDRLDESLLPIPVVPEQDITSWAEALRLLTSRRDVYEKQSNYSRTVALQFASNLSVAPFEDFLSRLRGRSTPIASRSLENTRSSTSNISPLEKGRSVRSIASLSPEQKDRLFQKLRKRSESG